MNAPPSLCLRASTAFERFLPINVLYLGVSLELVDLHHLHRAFRCVELHPSQQLPESSLRPAENREAKKKTVKPKKKKNTAQRSSGSSYFAAVDCREKMDTRTGLVLPHTRTEKNKFINIYLRGISLHTHLRAAQPDHAGKRRNCQAFMARQPPLYRERI